MLTAAVRSFYTTGDLAAMFAVPRWRLRHELELLEASGVPLQRAGRYRLVGEHQLEQVRAWLVRRGLLADGGLGSGTARGEQPGPCGETAT